MSKSPLVAVTTNFDDPTVKSPVDDTVPVTPTPVADSAMIAVAPKPMSDFDAPPVIRTLSTSTNPLSLVIVSPLVAPAAAVCVVATVMVPGPAVSPVTVALQASPSRTIAASRSR